MTHMCLSRVQVTLLCHTLPPDKCCHCQRRSRSAHRTSYCISVEFAVFQTQTLGRLWEGNYFRCASLWKFPSFSCAWPCISWLFNCLEGPAWAYIVLHEKWNLKLSAGTLPPFASHQILWSRACDGLSVMWATTDNGCSWSCCRVNQVSVFGHWSSHAWSCPFHSLHLRGRTISRTHLFSLCTVKSGHSCSLIRFCTSLGWVSMACNRWLKGCCSCWATDRQIRQQRQQTRPFPEGNASVKISTTPLLR